jgi:Tfp pilus assembly protein FimV
LDDIASGKDTDLALLEKAQAQAAAERIEMLEKQHEKDEQEKVALRALNKRFLDEIRSTKFNLCVLMDQLASAGKEREQLKLTLQCHETAQKILLGKVEQYEEYFSKKI